jgi:hypothetical protein
VRQFQRLVHWLASWSWSWSWWVHKAGVSHGVNGGQWQWRGGAARIVLGLLNPRWLQMSYHAAGGGCRNWACQVRSWSSEEAAWTGAAGSRWETGPLAQTCASVVGISMEPPVARRDWNPVSSNKARGYCFRAPCLPAEPHCSRGVQPGGFCAYALQYCSTWCTTWKCAARASSRRASQLPEARCWTGAQAVGASCLLCQLLVLKSTGGLSGRKLVVYVTEF